MNKKKLTVYVLLPLGVSFALNAMYFSGNIVLQRIVCPKLPPLPMGSWREFGLLENLQVLLLLAMAVTALFGVARKSWKLERAAFAVLALLACFVILEEIDYGVHVKAFAQHEGTFPWFQPAAEWPPELVAAIDWETEPFNLHNQGNLTDIIKGLVSLTILLLFIVAPLAARRVPWPWLRRLAPDRWAVLLIVLIIALRFATHGLAAWDASIPSHEPGAMGKNLSEFRELNAYYLFLIYFVDQVFFRNEDLRGDTDASA